MLNKDFLLKNIKKNLNNIDPALAMEYLLWLDKQTMYFRDGVLRHGYGLLPNDLKRGDIVWVEFGINIGTELSDIFTNGHYALVWEVDFGNVVVIPLTSRNSCNSPLCLNLGIIEGLNVEKPTNSYLKLDAIRSVSKRRIAKIASSKLGKIELDKDRIRLVKKHIYNFFIEDTYKIYNNNLEILNYIAYHIDNG
ncbi:MAG: type II toxin-antitoxin system PemK/MazF family toxin [Bacilli bacterium]|nr:type II toxin-antitoxin system PemK/MazF family toxin [Bacilli bacterium]